MPARNAASTITAALQSVLQQQYIREVLVIDDASTDGTGAIACGLGDPRIQVIPGDGAGIAAALNIGFASARGRLVARCDADDFYEPGRLVRQVPLLNERPDLVAVSLGFRSITARGAPVAYLACDGEARDVTDTLLDGQAVTSFCTWLVRREAVTATGGARRWFVTGEDLDLQFRLAAVGRVWHWPVSGYIYRLHDSSTVHSRSRTFNDFYECAAREFAHQRRLIGTDALERGCPPEIPADILEAYDPYRAAEQVAGQLSGLAWRAFEDGRLAEALGTQARALGHAPKDGRLWRGIVAMLLRAPGRAVRGLQ